MCFGNVKFRFPVHTVNRTRLMDRFLCRSCNYDGNFSKLECSALSIDIVERFNTGGKEKRFFSESIPLHVSLSRKFI